MSAVPDPERALVGAVLQSRTATEAAALIQSAGDLDADDFRHAGAGAAWRIASELAAAGKTPDPVSVAALLTPANCRAAAFVGSLLDGQPRLSNLESWAELIREQSTNTDRAVLVRVAGVKPEAVSWLWLHRIPRGKLTVLDGDPGLGKSTLTLDLAARLSRGAAMPGEAATRPPAGVLVLSAEDSIGDTIRPRLEAAGADLNRVVVLTAVRDVKGKPQFPSLPGDVHALREAARSVGAALIVVDPLMAYLNGRVDSHRDQDIRGALAQLADVGETTTAAVVLVRHLNKVIHAGGNPIYRGGGSIGIIGAARAGLLVAADPQDATRRIVAATKSNLGPMPPALAYRLVPIGDTVALSWEGATEHTAADLLAAQTATAEEAGARQSAEDFLAELLADGPIPSETIQQEAEAAGLSWRTVRRAQAALGVRATRKGGLGSAGAWYWGLPAKMATDPLRRPTQSDGHLRGGVATLAAEAPEASSAGVAEVATDDTLRAPLPDPDVYHHLGADYRAGDVLPDGRLVESIDGGIPTLKKRTVVVEGEARK